MKLEDCKHNWQELRELKPLLSWSGFDKKTFLNEVYSHDTTFFKFSRSYHQKEAISAARGQIINCYYMVNHKDNQQDYNTRSERLTT